MLFWIIAALISVAVAAILAVPLLRGHGAVAVAPDVALYRDQLAEVDRDLARGTLDPAEAERTRTEIARRLLGADRAAGSAGLSGEAPRRLSRITVAVTAVAVVGGTLIAYDSLGAPGYADLPLSARLTAAEARLADLPTQATAEAAVADLVTANRVTPPDEIAATVAQLRDLVAETPDALGELTLLRDFEAGVRNFPEAARLSAQINSALGFDLRVEDLLVELELMVLSTNGIVSAEAAEVLQRAIVMAPDHAGVIFYRGLLMDNIGRPDLAFGLWRPLAESTDGGLPYRARTRALITDAAWAAGINYTLPPDTTGSDTDAMIQGMVAQLSERLATQGGTAEEWAQLIRSLGVLGETDRARAIWTEAQSVFAGQEGLDLIAAAATEAGVAE